VGPVGQRNKMNLTGAPTLRRAHHAVPVQQRHGLPRPPRLAAPLSPRRASPASRRRLHPGYRCCPWDSRLYIRNSRELRSTPCFKSVIFPFFGSLNLPQSTSHYRCPKAGRRTSVAQVHEEDLSIFGLCVVDEEEESEDPRSGESIEHALFRILQS
jgi:hypothetical protein